MFVTHGGRPTPPRVEFHPPHTHCYCPQTNNVTSRECSVFTLTMRSIGDECQFVACVFESCSSLWLSLFPSLSSSVTFTLICALVLSGLSFSAGSASPPTWPTFGKAPAEKDKSTTAAATTTAAAGGGRGGLSHHKPAPPERVDSLRPDIPPELQGVSVKDLVKALGKDHVITPPPPKKKKENRESLHMNREPQRLT